MGNYGQSGAIQIAIDLKLMLSGRYGHLREVLDSNAKILYGETLAPDRKQPYLVRWVAEFLRFVRPHAGSSFEQTLGLFLAEIGKRTDVDPWQWSNKAPTPFAFTETHTAGNRTLGRRRRAASFIDEAATSSGGRPQRPSRCNQSAAGRVIVPGRFAGAAASPFPYPAGVRNARLGGGKGVIRIPEGRLGGFSRVAMVIARGDAQHLRRRATPFAAADAECCC